MIPAFFGLKVASFPGLSWANPSESEAKICQILLGISSEEASEAQLNAFKPVHLFRCVRVY